MGKLIINNNNNNLIIKRVLFPISVRPAIVISDKQSEQEKAKRFFNGGGSNPPVSNCRRVSSHCAIKTIEDLTSLVVI